MRGLNQIHPMMIPWKLGQIYLVTGSIKITAAKMLASFGRSHRNDLRFDVIHSINIAKADPEAVSLVIASDTLDPPKFCAAHREITHVIQADSPRIFQIANIKTGRIKSYALAWGSSDEIASQIASYGN